MIVLRFVRVVVLDPWAVERAAAGLIILPSDRSRRHEVSPYGRTLLVATYRQLMRDLGE